MLSDWDKEYIKLKIVLVCEVFRDKKFFQHEEVFNVVNFAIDDKIFNKCLFLRRVFHTYAVESITQPMINDAKFFLSVIDRLIPVSPPVFNSQFIEKWDLIKKDNQNDR